MTNNTKQSGKIVHQIQIQADNGEFINYSGKIGTGMHNRKFSMYHHAKKDAGMALKELQELVKGHGFNFRIQPQLLQRA